MQTEELIQQLSNTGNALWEASYRQNTISLIEMGGALVVMAVITVAWIALRPWAKKRFTNPNKYSGDPDGFWVYNLVGAIGAAFFAISTFIMMFFIIDILANPTWAAASRILGAMGD